MNLFRFFCVGACVGALAPGLAGAQEASKVVYRCPGPPVLYTDALSPQEAKEQGCRTIDGAPLTVVPIRRPAPASPSTAGNPAGGGAAAAAAPAPAAPAAPTAPNAAARPEAKVDASVQRSRDTDARRILEAELRREEERMEGLKREYNNGEPERRGDERNYAKYIERVGDLRSAIARKEADIAAIKREIAKLPP